MTRRILAPLVSVVSRSGRLIHLGQGDDVADVSDASLAQLESLGFVSADDAEPDPEPESESEAVPEPEEDSVPPKRGPGRPPKNPTA